MIDINIEFERECFKCYGHGYLLSSKEEKNPCDRCRGIGRVPTELGVELLEFLTNQGIKPAATEPPPATSKRE